MSAPLLQAQALSVRFGAVQAVSEASLAVAAGETLALVGESGSGKTTLARALLGLAPVSAGQVLWQGADVARLPRAERQAMRRAVQMVFQDPFGSLNPRLTVAEIIAEPLVVHRLGDAAARRARVLELLDQVGLPAEAAARYPHQFSGGQRQRIAIARALAPRPRLVIADEPLSALDVSIQSQILNLLVALREQEGVGYLFVSHDFAAVHHLADRVAVMYLGRIVETAPKAAIFAAPAHPYTAALLTALPRPGGGRRRPGTALQGEVPSPLAPPPGCAFHRRCPRATPRCAEEAPALAPLREDRAVACHFPLETSA